MTTKSPESDFVYYLTASNGVYELRQTRFKQQLQSGREHPHDVCAVARSKDEMRGMVESCKFTGTVDWDSVA